MLVRVEDGYDDLFIDLTVFMFVDCSLLFMIRDNDMILFRIQVTLETNTFSLMRHVTINVRG